LLNWNVGTLNMSVMTRLGRRDHGSPQQKAVPDFWVTNSTALIV
jgi:hypothetical protein